MFHPLHASFPLVSNVASPKVKEGRLSHMARKGSPIWGSPAAVVRVQIVFLADAFFVVFVPPMQLVDAVHQPFVIAFLNSVDDEGVFLHGGQIPFAHKIFARKIPQAVLDGREDTLGEDIGGNFKKTL